MSFYFMRHSEKVSDDNYKKTGRFSENQFDAYSGKNYKKIIKSQLSVVFEDNIDIKYIYSSPLTRCIETSIEIQKYFKTKYKKDLPIRIENGLIEIGYNNNDLDNITIKNNEIILTNSELPIDSIITQKNIYKNYSNINFDKNYESVITKETINASYSFIDQYKNVIKFLNELKNIKETNIYCTSGRVLLFLINFVNQNKKDNYKIFKDNFGWSMCIVIDLIKNKYKIRKIVSGIKI